jgi:hypothetical protein
LASLSYQKGRKKTIQRFFATAATTTTVTTATASLVFVGVASSWFDFKTQLLLALVRSSMRYHRLLLLLLLLLLKHTLNKTTFNWKFQIVHFLKKCTFEI